MSVSENNSVGRLYNLLRKAIANGDKNRSTSPSLMTVWQKSLGCETKSETIAAYLGVIELPDTIVEECRKANLPDSTFWFMQKLKTGIVRYNFNESWHSIANNFAGDLMHGLRSCADNLERTMPVRSIPQDIIRNLSVKAGELFSEIEAADLEPDLKNFLLKQIHSVEVALRQHQIEGVAPVEEALNQVIGSTIIEKSKWMKEKETPVTRKAIAFFQEVLVLVTASVIGTAINPPPQPNQQTIIMFQEAAEIWQWDGQSIALEEGKNVGNIGKQRALPSVTNTDSGGQKSASEDETSSN